MSALNLITDLTSFGAAGLMGALWLWERRLCRRYEQELKQAHERILRDEQKIQLLVQVVEKNTAAFVRAAQQQHQQMLLLKGLAEDLRRIHVS